MRADEHSSRFVIVPVLRMLIKNLAGPLCRSEVVSAPAMCDRESQRSSREPSADLNDPKAENRLDLDISRLGECSNRSSLVPVWCQYQPLFPFPKSRKIV